jgi:hypothetical protein
MPNARFIARTKTRNLRAELWLNDIPVAMLLPGEADGRVGIPLNDNLLPGANRIGVMLHAGPLASRSSENWAANPQSDAYSGAATLELFLAEYQVDQPVHVDGPAPIDNIDWQGAAEPVPALLERDFKVAAGFGRWAWQDAQVITAVEGEVRAGALNYLAHLHGMLAAGDFAAFVTESRTKLDEYARAYGIAAEPVHESMLEGLSSEAVKLSLFPLNPSDIDLRLVAGGRMIECLRKDRTHALEFRSATDGPVIFLPAMIGIAGGVWRMLR